MNTESELDIINNSFNELPSFMKTKYVYDAMLKCSNKKPHKLTSIKTIIELFIEDAIVFFNVSKSDFCNSNKGRKKKMATDLKLFFIVFLTNKGYTLHEISVILNTKYFALWMLSIKFNEKNENDKFNDDFNKFLILSNKYF